MFPRIDSQLGSLEVCVGPRHLSDANDARSVEVTQCGHHVATLRIEQLLPPISPELIEALSGVHDVTVGWTDLVNLAFLPAVPNTRVVWIKSPTVKDLSGLQYLPTLVDLAIDRPTCRMDLLGSLVSLRKLYLDNWRPGAQSIFELENIECLGLQKFSGSDLSGFGTWNRLTNLWLNSGRLETIVGIPTSVQELRLTSLRRLSDLASLSGCVNLERLTIEACKKVTTIAGTEGCLSLRTLSFVRSGPLKSLDPLRGLKCLEFVALAEGSVSEDTDVSALYELPRLATLIISKRTNIDRSRVLRAATGCDVRLVQ